MSSRIRLLDELILLCCAQCCCMYVRSLNPPTMLVVCWSIAGEMQKELKTGALWMSDLCDNTAERRGVGRSVVYSA